MEREQSVLSHAQAKHFYDHFGSKQDSQGFYEDKALDDLIAHASFDQAHAVFELGCGTGRFAQRLLSDHLSADSRYIGSDLSETMQSLTQKRVEQFGERAEVVLSSGDMRFPVPDQSVDRVIATYVFDLLSDSDMHKAIAESHRVLRPDGKICLVSLSQGISLGSRMVCRIWSGLFRWNASLIGGCRPIELKTRLEPAQWRLDYNRILTQFSVPSEILIATPRQ